MRYRIVTSVTGMSTAPASIPKITVIETRSLEGSGVKTRSTVLLLAKQTQAHLVLITGISPNSGAKNTLESTRQAPRAMTAYPAYPIVGFVSFTWVISSKTPDHLVT